MWSMTMIYRIASLALFMGKSGFFVEVDAAVEFLVTSNSVDPEDTSEHFVARIVDEDAIATARAEIEKTEGFQIISGTISKESREWNPNWSFHLIPDTVFFAEMFFEICDATVVFVEENLDLAGGAFLPNLQWCPWGTRVLEELGEVPDPTPAPSVSVAPTPSPSTGQPSTMAPTVNAVDFLVTSDATNVEDISQHFVARLVEETAIEQARLELNKTENFQIIAGTIEKTPASWNPGWSFHMIPQTVFFGEIFSEACDSTATFIEDNLDEAGFAFLPNLQWCPWETRVLAEITNIDQDETMAPTISPQPTAIPTLQPTAVPTDEPTMMPTPFTPFVDFLVTSDYTNVSNTAEHFIARIVHEASIAIARLELRKSARFRIISGIIDPVPVGWNPGWSYHLIPSTVFFGQMLTEVCDASATFVEDNLESAGGSFLPNMQWCPWGTRILAEVQAVEAPTPATTSAPTTSAAPSEAPSAPTTPAPSSFEPFVDFLVTSDNTDPLNTEQHFVARITNEESIADARAEVDKSENFRIISGTIAKEPVGWNPGWSYHLIPATVIFEDFFIDVCDATTTYVEENLDTAGRDFLPGLQWCPWGTRVLAEIQAVGTTAEPSVSSAPSITITPAPSSNPTTMAPTTPTTPVPTIPATPRPTRFFPYVDFLITSNAADPEDTSQHFVSRMIHESSIAQARAELNKTEGFMIVSGIIEKEPVDWNPGWSYHLIPATVFFGEMFMEVCDANAVYVEENLESAGGSFLPRLQWCPWGTRVLKELQAVEDPDAPPPTDEPVAPPQPPASGAALSRSISSFVAVVTGTVVSYLLWSC